MSNILRNISDRRRQLPQWPRGTRATQLLRLRPAAAAAPHRAPPRPWRGKRRDCQPTFLSGENALFTRSLFSKPHFAHSGLQEITNWRVARELVFHEHGPQKEVWEGCFGSAHPMSCGWYEIGCMEISCQMYHNDTYFYGPYSWVPHNSSSHNFCMTTHCCRPFYFYWDLAYKFALFPQSSKWHMRKRNIDNSIPETWAPENIIFPVKEWSRRE